MRILRIRRGFTTNSSASSEWIPTPNNKPDEYPLPSPGGTPFTKVVLPMHPESNMWSNAWKGGGLVAVIALVFAVDRIVRRLRGRRQAERADDAEE